MKAIAEIGIVCAALGLMCGGSYVAGSYVTAQGYKADIADMKANQATALAAKEAEYRAREKRSADDMAAIDQNHVKAIQDEIISRDRIIADLRTDALQLRKRFTCGGTSMPAASTSTGSRDQASAGGLQKPDAEFLIRLASDADQVVGQLQACQAVVAKDRGQ